MLLASLLTTRSTSAENIESPERLENFSQALLGIMNMCHCIALLKYMMKAGSGLPGKHNCISALLTDTNQKVANEGVMHCMQDVTIMQQK